MKKDIYAPLRWLKLKIPGDLMASEPVLATLIDPPAWPEMLIALPFYVAENHDNDAIGCPGRCKIDGNPFVYGDNDALDKVTIRRYAISQLLRMIEKLDHLSRNGDFPASNVSV